MRHRLRSTLRSAALLGAAMPAAAQVRLLEAGIVCPRVQEGETRPAPGTQAGYVRMVPGLSFDMPGRTVPLVPDLAFGIRLELKADAPLEVTMVTRHPPMGPDGVTEQRHQTTLPAGDSYVRSYSFDFDYEMLPGTWEMGVELDGRTLVSVPFTVTRADDRRVTDICAPVLQS